MKKVSIIIPVFNEEDIIKELLARVIASTRSLINYDFEFILVDDGSTDNTLGLLLRAQEEEDRLTIIRLSRNWGYQNAFNAGLDYADSDAAILMDGDLEDPPEMVPTFLEKWKEGFDIVYAVKQSRQENRLKKFMFSIFYGLMERFSEVRVDRQAGMFSLLDRKIIQELNKCKERHKYYVGLRSFVGFKKTQVFYHRDKRYKGIPKQSFRKLINYAMDAIFSFSFFPIRILTYFGLAVLTIIVFYSFFLIIANILKLKFWLFHNLPGWTSIVLIMFFMLGVQIMFMGILGEYIARIFDEVKNRPYYIVENIYKKKKTNSYR